MRMPFRFRCNLSLQGACRAKRFGLIPSCVALILGTTLMLAAAQLAARASVLPEGFVETTAATGLTSATSMAFAPDGRLFVCEQAGHVRVVKDGVLLPTPFVSVSVDSSGERGLLGIAFDPDFASNQYVYVYYTVGNVTPRYNRVSRFTANGDVAAAGSEVLIFRLEDLDAQTHNAGALHFGPDGKLYVAVGDNVRGIVAQSLDNLFGKILRLNPDGTIPADNPFYNTATDNRRAIWALGLRNPFTFAIQPGTGKMYINDVGATMWEEVNEGIAGSNYGWPTCEGNCSTPGFLNPVYTYAHTPTGCDSIAGGTFYNPAVSKFPQKYIGKYFFSDWCKAFIKMVDPATNTTSDFGNIGNFGVVDLDVGPDGALYYLLQSNGYVYKIEYTGILAPVISTEPSDQLVSDGYPATFFVEASGDAPFTYQWQKNGADIPGATSNTYTQNAAPLSDNGAKFRVVVTNMHGEAMSREALLTVTTNKPPTGTITSPAAGTLYKAGDTVNFAGQASDFEDGMLPAGAFTWKVDFHHEAHAHPFVPQTSGVTGGSFTIPTTGETSSDVWYRIYLTVVDSFGLTHTSYRDVLPRKSNITLASNFPNVKLTLDGQPVTAPHTFTGVVGMTRTLAAPASQFVNGVTYEFVSWSDGGAIAHDISTPAADTTYTATFRQRTNVALQVNGGVASASSTFRGYGFTPLAVINADRKGLNWLNGGGWNDATAATYPDWVQVAFDDVKSITEIDVFTLQDNYTEPVEPTETQTFTQSGITAFDVQYWDGATWITVPGGAVTGNNKIWTKFTFAPIMTDKIRVTVNNSLGQCSRITEIEAYTDDSTPPPPPPTRVNVALASNGATATASTFHTGYAPSGAINGERKGLGLGQDGYWSSRTAGFPAWLEVNFNGSKTIDEIDLFTVQDNYSSPSPPTEDMTFRSYGLTGYDVQYWDGATWVTITGGSVTGNNKVWRKFVFTSVTTTKIRVLTNSSPDSWSRVTEIEAYAASDTPPPPPPPPTRINVALASNGATATASTFHTGYAPSGAINGERKGLGLGQDGYWSSRTAGFPAWLEVNFNGSKTIDEIDLFTVQDNYSSPSPPTEEMTFASYGLTGYDVQYWDGATWVTIPNGSVTGSNHVWKKFVFASITTTKIRVLTNSSPDSWSRVTEIEAYETPSP